MNRIPAAAAHRAVAAWSSSPAPPPWSLKAIRIEHTPALPGL